jgi:hypothetical protein
LGAFSSAFTQPTFVRAVVLGWAAILTVGRRTVQNLLRTVGTLAPGHPSSYHRVFSRRRWSLWPLGRTLTRIILETWLPTGPVFVAGDDTVDEHRGDRVYGKGCHRDAVRSTHSFTAYRWGHKWVVLAILVRFPFARRPWALPILVALYRPEKIDEAEGRRHKTCPHLMRQLLALLLHAFPERQFVFAGDGGYGTHDLARFAQSHRNRLTLISRFYPGAALYEPPPPRSGRAGRPRMRGRRLPSPREVVAHARPTRRTVTWYGGEHRRVEIVTGTGRWWRSPQGLVALRWVFVHDLTGTHRDEYFFSTDPELSPERIVGVFTGRWSIETTFQEVRRHLGLETTSVRTKASVLRAAPCLFGLYSVVALLFANLPEEQRRPAVLWEGKRAVTFSDAITAVRRRLWRDWVFATPALAQSFEEIPRPLRAILLNGLAPAA